MKLYGSFDVGIGMTHGYDTVTAEILWMIVSKPLPILHKEVKKLLQQKRI
jgi:uncharacterized protein with HEPN domain